MAMRKISRVLATGRVRESFEGDPVKPVFRPFNSACKAAVPDFTRIRLDSSAASISCHFILGNAREGSNSFL